MANFGRKHVYVLGENDQPDVEAGKEFLAKHGDQPFLIFGFTWCGNSCTRSRVSTSSTCPMGF
jgi:hypothetical protein